ncbi:hypothetical protein BKA62DRAFT_701171 [Auriculariales sp. MPI-PUGE-AT-0066]|nr:hypothetical protein BKA62DRAFT_701171 [Auriculariales sp. MPI-PUGE-AT-0066]
MRTHAKICQAPFTMYTHLPALLIAALTLGSSASAAAIALRAAAARQAFTLTSSIFLENIATRSNGNLLLTTLSYPRVYTVNPSQSLQPTILATFDSPVANSLSDIATKSGTNTTIWTMDLRGTRPTVRQVVQLPAGTMGNGLTTLTTAVNPGTVLVADTTLGQVWSVNVVSGVAKVVIKDDNMAPVAGGIPLGINGLRLQGSYLYFINSSKLFAARIPIHRDGTASGAVEVLATGRLWIASHVDAVDVVSSGGSQIVAVTGLNVSATDGGPTSCAFGRGNSLQEQILYVTTGGGNIFAVDTGLVAL